jgi:hypothetical protein
MSMAIMVASFGRIRFMWSRHIGTMTILIMTILTIRPIMAILPMGSRHMVNLLMENHHTVGL